MMARRAGIGFVLLLAGGSAYADPVQSLESVRDAAREAALAALQPLGGEARIDAVLLDQRLRLPACGQPLQAQVDGAPGARLIALVTCHGPATWSLRVPVQAQVLREVVVAAQAIARNVVVTADAVRSETRNVLVLPHGYFPDPAAVIGQQATRAIRAGVVLAAPAIGPARLVRRGDRVTLTSGDGAITVRSEGVALGDGAQGQRVQVRNARSGRVIEGEVVASNIVAALP